MPKKEIEIRFTGSSDVFPGRIRSKDLAEVITATEDMIASVVVKENPTLKKESIVIGLSSIHSGSIRLSFVPQMEQITYPAFLKITDSIKTNDYSRLPASSIKSLKDIILFSKKNDCDTEFRTNNGQEIIYATITPSTKIEFPKPLRGETTILGKVLRVGGVKPRIMLELPGGEVIYCDVDMNIATQLGKRLYKVVGLIGIATWNFHDLNLEEFEVLGITQYDKSFSITEVMSEISLSIGKYFNDIDNVEQYVSELRA